MGYQAGWRTNGAGYVVGDIFHDGPISPEDLYGKAAAFSTQPAEKLGYVKLSALINNPTWSLLAAHVVSHHKAEWTDSVRLVKAESRRGEKIHKHNELWWHGMKFVQIRGKIYRNKIPKEDLE